MNSKLKDTYRKLGEGFDLAQLRNIVLFTVIFGFIVHGACFFGITYSHDGIGGVIQGHENVIWKIQIGRFMQALSIYARGFNGLAMPLGLISLIAMGGSVYLIGKTIGLGKTLHSYLLSALFVTSSAYISTVALFAHELDAFMYALLLATMSAYTHERIGYRYGLAPLLLALSCGFYQAYAGVTIVLLMILIIQQILDGRDINTTFKSTLQAIITIGGGLLMYLILFKSVAWLTNVGIASTEESYNSIENVLTLRFDLLGTLQETYFCFISRALCTAYPHRYIATTIANLAIWGYMCALIIAAIRSNKVSKTNIYLLTAIICLIPLGGCIATFLSKGVNTSNMAFAVTMVYVLLFALHKSHLGKKIVRITLYALLLFIISNSVLFANKLYTFKAIHLENTQMIMHDVYKEIMQHKDYIRDNKIEVAFVGDVNLCPQIGYAEEIRQKEVIITYHGSYYHFFRLYFNTIFTEPTDEEAEYLSTDAAIIKMPHYPADGYVQKVGNRLVVKFPIDPNPERWE